MSEMNEMPDVIWVYEADGSRESGSWTSTCNGDKEVEYRRIPTLPDEMEDGFVVMESGGYELVIRITDDEIFYETELQGWTVAKCIPHDILGFMNLPDLSNYHVQDGKIVRREG